jgi:hypothetical protein
MREKLARFMQGRYGNDGLNRFFMIAAIVCLVISFFGGSFFYLLAILLLVFTYFRMFSRNGYKRAAENQRFMMYMRKFQEFWLLRKNHLKQRKNFRFFTCPKCKQKLRIPKGKGKIEITCRKCGEKFVRKT